MDYRVVTFDMPRSIAGSMAQIRKLGDVTGRRKQAAALVREIEQAVTDAQRHDVSRPSVAVWQAGGIVPGEAALVTQLLKIAGFRSQTAENGFQQSDYLSLEQVVADPPDILLIAGSEAGQRHRALDAVPDMQRVPLDPSLIYCGGPTIIAALARLAAIRAEWQAMK